MNLIYCKHYRKKDGQSDFRQKIEHLLMLLYGFSDKMNVDMFMEHPVGMAGVTPTIFGFF